MNKILIYLLLALPACAQWPGGGQQIGAFWQARKGLDVFPVDTNSLILYVKFDEADVPIDHSVNAFVPDLYVSNACPFYVADGFIGGCWAQTNIYGYVNFTNGTYFDGYLSNISISAWVNFYTNTPSDNNRMFERRDSTYNINSIYDAPTTWGSRLDNSRNINLSVNLKTNWHHIAMVRWTNYVVYVDGVAADTNNSAPSYSAVSAHLTLFNGCVSEYGVSTYLAPYFKMDEFMWFATNLTPAEVLKIYQWGVEQSDEL